MRLTFSHKLLSPSLLYILLLLHTIPIHCEDTSSSILFEGTLPPATTMPAFPITPGVTNKLIINLSGTIDKLTITFTEDSYQVGSYILSIKNGNLPETSQAATFDEPENLTLSLNNRTGLFVIQGNVRFRMSKIVRERLYDIQVTQETVLDTTTPSSTSLLVQALQLQNKLANPDKTYIYYIIAGVFGGIIGLIAIIKLVLYLRKRSKNRRRIIRRSSKKKPSNGREVHPEVPSPTPIISPIFMLEDHSPGMPNSAQKSSLNLDDKILSDNEIDVVQHVVPPNKKEILCSLTSLESGMARATNANSTSTIPSSNVVSSNGSITSMARDLESSRVNRHGSKKGTNLEAITEEQPSYLRSANPADSGRGEREYIEPRPPMSPTRQPLKGVKLPKLIMEQRKARTVPNVSKQEYRAKNYANANAVSMVDIKRLAQKAMMEKKNRIDSDVSESDEEEQRAEPANFFCCMVCKAEKRSTIAEPCGHIFACEKCVKKMIETSKKCKLCSRRVKSYRGLKE